MGGAQRNLSIEGSRACLPTGTHQRVRRRQVSFLTGTEVKATEYFKYMRKRPDRARIEDDWTARVIDLPERIEV